MSDLEGLEQHATRALSVDPRTGLIVKSVMPAPGRVWWANYRDPDDDAEWITPVIAWAECETLEGSWAGLFPVVLCPSRLQASIAWPKDGYRGLSRATRGAAEAWPE